MRDNAFYKVTNYKTGKTAYCKTIHGAIIKILEIEEDKAKSNYSSLDEYAQKQFFYDWKDLCDTISKSTVDYFTHKHNRTEFYCGGWTIKELFFTV